jgi:Arc/MetJ-type ribon-helix-helix transcriptional regulator
MNKSETTKKSVSMPADLWEFVEQTAGIYGQKSKVIQEALRQMRDKAQNDGKRNLESGQGDFKKAAEEVKSSAKK